MAVGYVSVGSWCGVATVGGVVAVSVLMAVRGVGWLVGVDGGDSGVVGGDGGGEAAGQREGVGGVELAEEAEVGLWGGGGLGLGGGLSGGGAEEEGGGGDEEEEEHVCRWGPGGRLNPM